jgi:hypothetical protein
MESWIMIEVKYGRLPRTTMYKGTIQVARVTKEGEKLSENSVQGANFPEISMPDLVEALHHELQLYPEAKVTMIQELTRPGVFKTENRQGYELSLEETNLVRNDLTRALKLFEPIEQTVNMKGE